VQKTAQKISVTVASELTNLQTRNISIKNRQAKPQDLHIQYDICSHHEEAREHFHDKQYPQIFHVSLIFHMHIVGATCCPFHPLPRFGAEENKRVLGEKR
jgi:hypothetical protein